MRKSINKKIKIISAAIMSMIVVITSQASVLAAPAHSKLVMDSADANCYLDINIDLVYAGGWMESSWEMGMKIEGDAKSVFEYYRYIFENSGEDTYGISAYTKKCEYGFDSAKATYSAWTYDDERGQIVLYR